MSETCKEHYKLTEQIGSLNAKMDMLLLRLEGIDKRINGSFNAMSQHIKESAKFRNQTTSNATSIKVLMWLFGIFCASGVFLALVR